MENVYTTSVSIATIDESPMAYKPMEQILETIEDTCEVLKIIKPIWNVKASDEVKNQIQEILSKSESQSDHLN